MSDPLGDIVISPSGTPGWKPGKAPKYIYHYTNSSGLMGILNSKSLWATDVWYMNDTGEATYAIETITRFIESCTPESEEMRSLCFYVKKILNNEGWSEASPRHYISCLSENGDQLSQWRSYGYGRGYSIGFDLQALLQLFSGRDAAGSLGKVIYDQSFQETLISDLYQEAERVLHGLLGDSDAQANLSPHGLTQLTTAVSGFLASSSIVSDFFKHPAFSEEAEARIHASRAFTDGKPTGDVKFRDSTLGITSYVEIPLCPPGVDHISVIREIIIGPQPHQHEVQRAVGQLFAANGLPDVEIRLSQVPLRA
jgi:Protein of unknown function (DUF2971)